MMEGEDKIEEKVSIRGLQHSVQSLRGMLSVGEGHNAGLELHACMNAYSYTH